MTMEMESGTAPEKSTFVNALAWIFIVLGGFATLISLLQNIMFHMVFPKEQMAQAMHQSEQTQQVPAFAAFMFNHIDLFFLFFLLVSAFALISAIGLLKRMNWARLIFIFMMALGIAWNIGGLVWQLVFFNSMPEMTGGNVPEEMQNMMHIMQVFSAIMVIAFTALFAYIIKKLTSSEIRAEFS